MSAKYPVRSKRDIGSHLHLDDPYLPRGGFKEPTICSSCHAVYLGKKWSLDPRLVRQVEKDPSTAWINCPACRKIKDH